MYIEVTYAVQVFKHGHPGLARDAFDQPLATSWHDHIHYTFKTHHDGNSTPVSGIYNLDGLLGQARRHQTSFDALR